MELKQSGSSPINLWPSKPPKEDLARKIRYVILKVHCSMLFDCFELWRIDVFSIFRNSSYCITISFAKVSKYNLRLLMHEIGCHKKNSSQTTNKSLWKMLLQHCHKKSGTMIMGGSWDDSKFHLLQTTSIYVVSWEI